MAGRTANAVRATASARGLTSGIYGTCEDWPVTGPEAGPAAEPPDEPADQPANERAGRYTRSFAGMIGAMLISLLVIGAFVAFRALNRDELDVKPQAVDYLDSVGVLQESGVTVVYPPTLPDGWVATSIDFQPGERPVWGVGFLTDTDTFAGVRQEDVSLDELVDTYVDENATEGETVRIESDVADTWRQFEDEGGDSAFAAEVAGQWVLVYGSADRSDLEGIVESLTTEPVAETS